jgi:pimeloyl-ACP methyl ester carboxylesterase
MQTVLMRPRTQPRALLVAALACSALLSGCSGGHSSSGTRAAGGVGTLQATSAGYEVPARLAPAAPGTLIAVRDAAAQARRVGAGRAWQMLYHSTSLSGHDIAVSGLVLLPKGVPPAHGWPVAAWAHGTTGLADQCAPSIATDLGHDSSAVREVGALLLQNLAVVASDYPGLGTPGVHTYLIGQADARAVIDSVTAAHSLLGTRVSASWITVGHSEGGQTALFVAQAADQRAPRLNFLGTVALAPASTLNALIPFAEGTKDPVEQAYLVYALEGLSAVDANVHVEPLLTPQARALLPVTTKGCIDDIVNDFTSKHVNRLLDTDSATKDRLSRALAHYDNPDQMGAAEPILITQGIADRDVPAIATQALVTRLCALGDRVEYRLYAGLDHNNLVAGSQGVITGWITARLAHDAPPTTCKPTP